MGLVCEIYTDGSAEQNGKSSGKGGLGYVILYNGLEYRGSVGYFNTTNNRMEYLAVILPLMSLQRPTRVTVYTDSDYVLKAMTQWCVKWERRNFIGVKNVDLVKRLWQLCHFHTVGFIKVKAHSGVYYNEVCDKLARAASKHPTRNDIGFS